MRRESVPEPDQPPPAPRPIDEGLAFAPTALFGQAAATTNASMQLFAVDNCNPASSPVLGQVIGDYEIMDLLGMGGMGAVYRARQCRVGRIVALKIIRPDALHGLSTESRNNLIQRFRAEAKAAARLEHDHVVTVYEVGEANGLHYFSMRYVEGRSLADVLRNGPLDNRRAAELLECVSRAVHAAHVRGILHRDIKPHNLLIDSASGRALVADFGLAKTVEGDSSLTRHGEVLGTPAYMSPEQIRSSARVSAASDVYSLGATLYHVLTGRPPHQAATPLETLEQVMFQEPAPPRRLNPSVSRDLETICLACLTKDHSSRVASAEILADELRRYLDGLPIKLRPIGPLRRFARWCRRNRMIAALLAISLVGILSALAATSIGYVVTSAAKQEADVNFRDARLAIDEFFTWFSEEALLDQPGMQHHRHELLQRALVYYQKFLKRRGQDPQLQHDVAMAQVRVGLIVEELESAKSALPHYQAALKTLKTLSDSERKRHALGDVWNAIGRAYYKLDRLDDALAANREAIRIRELLAAANPQDRDVRRKTTGSIMNLALVERDRSHFDKAFELLAKAQQMRQQLLDEKDDLNIRRDLAMGNANWANMAFEVDDLITAIHRWQQSAAQFEQLLADQPFDLQNRFRLAVCYRGLGNAASEIPEALAHYAHALRTLEPLAQQNPGVVRYQEELGTLHINVGELEFEQQNLEAAQQHLQQARSILERLVKLPNAEAETRGQLQGTIKALELVEDAMQQRAAAPADSQ